MLIINADDFGKCSLATDRILSCYNRGTITSTSAMVFMADSQRAGDLAIEYCIDVGLHLNFTQELTQHIRNSILFDYHDRIAGYLTKNRYNFLLYNPSLRKQFKYLFQAQLEEFEHIYGKLPSHINGHHHMHLCSNMLIECIIPEGQKVRRNFSFDRKEKSFLNRAYRALVDKWLNRQYQITDYFFSLSKCINSGRIDRVLELSKTSNVELETHPEIEEEFALLVSNDFRITIANYMNGTNAHL